MSKTIAKVALIAGAAVLVVASGGTLAPFIGTAVAGVIGAGATATLIGSLAATLLVTTALSAAASLVVGGGSGQSGISAAQISRLNISLIPSTPRVFVFGQTAFATDLRASIPSGTNQEFHEYVICCASHTVQSLDEIWFEDRLAWSLAGGIAAYYAGYITTVTVINPGTNANGIAINSQWTANCTLTGCAYVYIKIRRTGLTTKASSPLASGIPSRVTIVGKGAKVYDPRLDSTVTGGSGSHRTATQSTWEYTNSSIDRGNNPALQLLAYLLGWQINSKLAVGKGMPAARIDLPSFIAAANICDEAVTLAAGGTQRRYEGGALFSEADTPGAVMDTLLTACNGRLTDVNGKLGIVCATNDLTGTLYAFTDDDVLDAFDWNPSPSIHETHNIVRGRYTDPSSNSLYQLVDYPAVRITSPDGIDRVLTLDLPATQEGRRAQRIAKQVLQREQYQGTFSAIFGIRAWGVQVGDPVKLTYTTLGFTNKLFRVVQQGIRSDGTVAMVLREEATALYAWAAEESALVTVAPPTVYNQLNNPLSVTAGVDIGVANGATKNVVTYSSTAPASPVDGVDVWVDTSATPNVTKYRVAGAWQTGASYVTQGTDIGVANAATNNMPVISGTTPASPFEGQIWKDTSTGVLNVYSAGAWLRLANDVTGTATPGISATGSTSSITKLQLATTDPQTLTTNSVTVTPSGGSAYSYAWAYLSGDTVNIGSPTSATTTVNKSVHYTESFDGTIRCVVTSTAGATLGAQATVDVNWSITETH